MFSDEKPEYIVKRASATAQEAKDGDNPWFMKLKLTTVDLNRRDLRDL